MSRVILYVRVSTEVQASEDSYGIDAQREDARRYADQAGLAIVAERVDTISGTNGLEDREALPEAVEAIEAGQADGLLVARLDRLARKLTTQEALLAAVWSRGGVVHAADDGLVPKDDPDDPMRTAMRQMAGVFAELDRRMIAKRLRDGRRVKAATGGYIGGFRPETAPDAETRALALREAGETMRGVAARLGAEGYETPRGGPWQASTVQRMLRRAERRAASRG